jgi:hypothetical protein
MKYALAFLLAASCAFAQDAAKTKVVYQNGGFGMVTSTMARGMGAPVVGAPYSATITNESIQTLADGNRIVQSSNGETARDSQGRTRQDAAFPAIGNLSAANAPHVVFILDPVGQTSYTLNLTDKTAQKLSMPPAISASSGTAESGAVVSGAAGSTGLGASNVFFVQAGTAGPMNPPPPLASPGIAMQKAIAVEEDSQINTEDLGAKTMEGILVNGVRTTRTIPAGEIGNENPITITTEVWTSPDLKTVIYSKRNDPRIGEQTFKLTNIVRAEPDGSLFTVPADFKVVDGPQNLFYRSTNR